MREQDLISKCLHQLREIYYIDHRGKILLILLLPQFSAALCIKITQDLYIFILSNSLSNSL